MYRLEMHIYQYLPGTVDGANIEIGEEIGEDQVVTLVLSTSAHSHCCPGVFLRTFGSCSGGT